MVTFREASLIGFIEIILDNMETHFTSTFYDNFLWNYELNHV